MDGSWAGRFIAATAVLWIGFATIVGIAADAPARGFEPIGAQSVFAAVVVLAVWRIPAIENARAIVAACLLLLAVEGQIAGFHGSRPSPWDCVVLSGAALVVALVCRGEIPAKNRRDRQPRWQRRA